MIIFYNQSIHRIFYLCLTTIWRLKFYRTGELPYVVVSFNSFTHEISCTHLILSNVSCSSCRFIFLNFHAFSPFYATRSWENSRNKLFWSPHTPHAYESRCLFVMIRLGWNPSGKFCKRDAASFGVCLRRQEGRYT